MIKQTSILSVIVVIAGLSGCATYNPYGYANYNNYVYDGRPLYPEVHEQDLYYYRPYSSMNMEVKREVVVPETYHMNSYRVAPISHIDQDRTWVEGQNPKGYTIEVADKEKASEVAGALQSAPKNDRRAQIRYERDGKSYYKGVYGSYPSYEAAQQALGSLPPNVKAGANIKTWGSVQGNVNQ